MTIPEQYLPVMPYLILQHTSDFLSFAKHVFGATEQMIVPAANGEIMHGELKIHDAVIMFAEATDQWNAKTAGMFIYVSDLNQVYQAALNHGAKSLMPPEHKDYGYTAGFEDPFGNQWWVVEGV